MGDDTEFYKWVEAAAAAKAAGQKPAPTQPTPGQAVVRQADERASQQALATGKPIERTENFGASLTNPYAKSMQVAGAVAYAAPYTAFAAAKGYLVDTPELLQNYHETSTAIRKLAELGHPMDQAMMAESQNLTGGLVMTGFGLGAPPAAGGMIKQLTRGGAIDKTLHPVFGSRGIEPENLAAAKAMIAEGKTPQAVWRETGVWEYRPGKFLRETDDSTLNFKEGVFQDVPNFEVKTDPSVPEGWSYVDQAPNRSLASGKLGDILTDSEVLDLYPEFKEINLEVELFGAGGEGQPRSGHLTLDPRSGKYQIVAKASSVDQARGIIVHELQHAVQEIEGLPRGGSNKISNRKVWQEKRRDDLQGLDMDITSAVAMVQTKEGRTLANKFVKEALAKKGNPTKQQQLYAELEKSVGEEAALDIAAAAREYRWLQETQYPGDHQVYKQLAGEVQARLAQQRTNLSPAERADVPPQFNARNPMGFKEDTAPADQIDRYERLANMARNSADEPTNPNTRATELDIRRAQKKVANDNLTPEQVGATVAEQFSNETPPAIQGLPNYNDKAAIQQAARRDYYFNNESGVSLNDAEVLGKVNKDLRSADPILWKRLNDMEEGRLLRNHIRKLDFALGAKDPVAAIKTLKERYNRWKDDQEVDADIPPMMLKLGEFYDWAYKHYFEGK